VLVVFKGLGLGLEGFFIESFKDKSWLFSADV
jgi:hypothetical protein